LLLWNAQAIACRDAWDGIKLQTLTKNPTKATGAHISIIGHITREELKTRLTRTDMANGFANRFLFALVKRSKFLPHGGHLPQGALEASRQFVNDAVNDVRGVDRVCMKDAAAKAWADAYSDLSADRPGLLGAVTARAEAQVVRLALIYALLDSSNEIDMPQLTAAMAVWNYCDESAAYIFGKATGNITADDIMAALDRTPNGMSRNNIVDLFSRNRNRSEISTALDLLRSYGLADCRVQATGGRPAEIWFPRVARATR
jgi:hypothetical protein